MRRVCLPNLGQLMKDKDRYASNTFQIWVDALLVTNGSCFLSIQPKIPYFVLQLLKHTQGNVDISASISSRLWPSHVYHSKEGGVKVRTKWRDIRALLNNYLPLSVFLGIETDNSLHPFQLSNSKSVFSSGKSRIYSAYTYQ